MRAEEKYDEETLNCAVFVNSFVQAAEVMERMRKESEIRMRKIGFGFVRDKKHKLNKIHQNAEEIRRLFEDAFLYGEHPIEGGLFGDGKKYDSFLATASEMAIIFLLIMDRCHTSEQEQQLFDLLNSMPAQHVTKEEIDRLRMR